MLPRTDRVPLAPPEGATAALVLADSTVFWGKGLGATGLIVGEVCFNTSITGYQEILTDPSYAGQMITFTFPHIGNVGINTEDVEATMPSARGLVLAADVTAPSNWRATDNLCTWLESTDLVGISGLDTRHLTRCIRDGGAPSGAIWHAPDGIIDVAKMHELAVNWTGLEGMDLAKEVTCRQTYEWVEPVWGNRKSYDTTVSPKFRVVAIDFGAKRNILRSLASLGCAVTVVPATSSAEEVLRHRPDGIFLTNGPGDPTATALYAAPVIHQLLKFGVPMFGICLGHQMLALALGAKTKKMLFGHRGANHPVKELSSGKVEITSQNHGFEVLLDSLPAGVNATHVSLFDGTLEGLEVTGKSVFSVQHHPEASPGPQDSHYLFDRFVALMDLRNSDA